MSSNELAVSPYEPSNLTELMAYANMLAKSPLMPKHLVGQPAKGRAGRSKPSLRGELHHSTTLTNDAVAESRATPRRYGTGVALARKFNVSPTTISAVRARQSWRYAP